MHGCEEGSDEGGEEEGLRLLAAFGEGEEEEAREGVVAEEAAEEADEMDAKVGLDVELQNCEFVSQHARRSP